MGHYPIKCIHCMRTIDPDERCIRVSRSDIIADVGSSDSSSVEVNEVFTLNENISAADARSYGSMKGSYRNGSAFFVSIRELREHGNIAYEEFYDGQLSGEYRDLPGCRSRMSQAIHVRDVGSGSQKLSGTVRTFYCPHCHQKLIGQAGKKPMYLISILGPTSAGKTVFLTILHLMLNGRNYYLPKGYLHFEAVGSTVSEYHEYAQTLNSTGVLPGTTTGRKDPYLLEVNYVSDPDSRRSDKSCVIGLTDMRGEMLGASKNDELMRTNLPQFVEADGFIMMIDPEILEGFYKRMPEDHLNRDYNALSLALTDMCHTINDCITSVIGAIKKPNVIALTKMDLLRRYRDMIGLSLSDCVIAPRFSPVKDTNLYRNYYLPMSRSTRQCVERLSDSFSYYLSTVFERVPYYVSISALGDKVEVSGDKVDNPMNIAPIRIEEPIIHLLMDLNFLPPFNRDLFYQFPEECMKVWKERYAEP